MPRTTHDTSAWSEGALTSLRNPFANALRSHARPLYGTRLQPTLGVLGSATARLSRAFRNAIKGEASGLVRLRPQEPDRSLILDVGCGSGLSLLRARDAGWRVMGIEPDDAATRTAKARGIEVVARHLEDLPSAFNGTFERIMLSHVIKHVHDPLAMLRRCRELLAPGGTLWLETPTCPALATLSSALIGADWRGLEPPRHLVMWRSRPLEALLERAGLGKVGHCEPREVWAYMFEHSVGTRQKRQRDTAIESCETVGHYIRRARETVAKTPERAEFQTLTATA